MPDCTDTAITKAKPECGCWEWLLCPKHDLWMQALLAGGRGGFCSVCRKILPVTLEDL